MATNKKLNKTTIRRKITPLINAGEKMANLIFNLSKIPNQNPQIKVLLDRAFQDWDKEKKSLPYYLQPQPIKKHTTQSKKAKPKDGCPCPNKDCDLHGNCYECKKRHHGKGESTYCEKLRRQ